MQSSPNEIAIRQAADDLAPLCSLLVQRDIVDTPVQDHGFSSSSLPLHVAVAEWFRITKDRSATASLPLVLPESSPTRTYRSAIVNLDLMNGSIKVEEMLRDFLAPQSLPESDITNAYRYHWNLDRPKIIFHITGTANPLRLSGDPLKDFMQTFPGGWFFLRMKEFIVSVLFDIALGQDGAAWMFDGGTKCGIMKLVGNLHKEVFSRLFVYPQRFAEGQTGHEEWHSTFPLIGVSELSKIEYSSLSEYNQADWPKETGPRFPPDDDHTHHLFMQMRALKCASSKSHDGPVISRFFSDLNKLFECPVVCCC
jgi:hypothetical protein